MMLERLRAGATIHRADPRLRVVVAVAMAVVVAMAERFDVLAMALAAALLGLVLAGLPSGAVLKRIVPLNAILLALLGLLPLTTAGTPLVTIGPLDFSREGLLLGMTIVLKGNAIVLSLIVLLGTLDAATLGHALSHLRVPDKLAHLLLFTVRYLDVLRRESLRLRVAMKARGFRPRMNVHTYRSFGHLVGMLLVRSLDRSERIVAAMKCRGFRGRFYLLDHFHFSWYDLPFGVASTAVLLLLILVEWT